jgi:hypothetical protein
MLVEKGPFHDTGDSSIPDIASDFNAPVTSNIFQSPCGQGVDDGTK